jgi:uncharacterized repeat protein (TIGR03803 family)
MLESPQERILKTLLYPVVLLCAFHACSFAQTYSVLHGFSSSVKSPDGNTPLAGLIRDAEGNLYGTTFSGVELWYGTVFKLDSSGKENILYGFTGGSDGSEPSAGLIQDRQHNLYGTTSAGGQSGCGVLGLGCGVVFKLSPGGKFTVLYTFTGGADGAAPLAALVRDGAGNLYGTTSQGGSAGCVSSVRSGCGTVFKLSQNGKLTVLHSFTGNGSDGGIPLARLLRDESGNLYGTASVGGSFSSIRCLSLGGCGTVFRISAKGKFSVLDTFQGYPSGENPTAGLIRDSKGNLYGTSGGGPNYTGQIFKLDRSGRETVLYSFSAYPSPDGAGPAGLVRDADGNFYGTAAAGGAGFQNCPGIGCGTVFKLDSSGKFTVLAALGTGTTPGSVPQSGVILDHEGYLYGTGSGNTCKLGLDCGEVFKIVP